jgi:hypothetical protein
VRPEGPADDPSHNERENSEHTSSPNTVALMPAAGEVAAWSGLALVGSILELDQPAERLVTRGEDGAADMLDPRMGQEARAGPHSDHELRGDSPSRQ